jgi:hypothetical protein
LLLPLPPIPPYEFASSVPPSQVPTLGPASLLRLSRLWGASRSSALALGEEVMSALEEVGMSKLTEIHCVSATLVLAGTSSMLGSHIGSRKTLIYLLRCLHSTFVSARREDISLDTLGKILYWCRAPLIPSDGRFLL